MSNKNEQQSINLDSSTEPEIKSTEIKKEEKPKVTRQPRNTQSKTSPQKATVADFVTNPDAPIYAIKNLPEEYVATLFAWVSRSSKSFKEHLAEAIKEFNLLPPVGKTDDLADKAKAFHDKWTVGYGHSCYDEETQVLTKRGFIDWKDVTLDDEFASVNPKNNNIEYQNAVRLIKEKYKGPMYKVDRNRLDMLVTPNHRLYAWPRHKIDGHVTREYQLIKASDLDSKCYKVKLGGLSYDGDVTDTLYGYNAESLLKLFGFFIGDGYIDIRSKKALQFHIKKQRKIDFLYEVCEDLGLNISANKNDKFYITSEKKDIGLILQSCYDDKGEKQIPREFFDLDPSLLHCLYEGLINSDGCITRTGEVYDTTSLILSDQIQELCLLLGWTSSKVLKKQYGLNGKRVKGLWRVYINKKLLESMVNKVQYDIMDEWVNYDGTVYCAELPKYHTLIVRRNGKIHISGNSVAEHAKASLGLEKVSRLFTSEIELASQFLSITEYSQRYQKPQRGDWYIIEHKDLKKPIEDAFNKLFDIFEKLIDLNLAEHIRIHKEQNGKEPTPKEKSAYEKLAFEDARYVLPLAMYSQLGISTNGRAWAEVLRNLGASTLKESVDVSIKAREELQKVLPSLLRHSSPSAYQLSKVDTLKDIKEEIAYYKSKTIDDILYRPIISSSMSYRDILMTLIKTSSMAAYTDNLKIENTSISRLSIEQLEVIVMALLKDMGAHDMPPDSFKHIMFTIELSVSEANWHQLHRHNRKADFSFGLIHPENGVTIPKIAQQSEDIYALYEEADSISSELYDTINTVLTLDGDTYKANYHAQYAALNMHHRNVYMTISLWSLHHLINLRTTEEAQWDIRNTFNKVYDLFVTRYPVFAHSLKRR